MKWIVCMVSGALMVACAAPSSQSNHQNLNVAECRALAQETLRSGKLNYNLCPGYLPTGEPVFQED